MSHYNLRSRLSATLPPQLTPPTSPPDESTVPEQPLHPSTTISKQDTPKSSSESKPYLQTPEDFVASEKRRKKQLRSDFHKQLNSIKTIRRVTIHDSPFQSHPLQSDASDTEETQETTLQPLTQDPPKESLLEPLSNFRYDPVPPPYGNFQCLPDERLQDPISSVISQRPNFFLNTPSPSVNSANFPSQSANSDNINLRRQTPSAPGHPPTDGERPARNSHTAQTSDPRGTMFKPNIIKLACFTGRDYDSLPAFLAKFQKFCSMNNIDRGEYANVLPFYLSDNAENFYNNLTEDIKSNYQELTKALAKRFQTKELDYHLIAIKQRENESCDDYISRALKISTDVQGLEEKVLVSLLVNGLRDSIKKDVILRQPESLSELAKYCKLCDMTTSFSVNAIDTKFQTLLEEIKTLKADIKIKEINALQSTPIPNIPVENSYAQQHMFPNQMPSVPYSRYQQFQPRQNQNYRMSVPLDYQRPRIVDRSVSNPRLQVHRQNAQNQICPKCGYDSCRGGRNCFAFNKRCNNCQQFNHFQSMCFRTKK
ncbi:hypothetical protein DPMN_054772 [Dreissena polymorpha]|uniref:Retrotransposon gag domain-containing protein n=1 Tax=Dreissena polymorpha TaxID=45954 RepID=A0A9D4CRA2_DREPO|nr:hypothetical protein DPMN_054772 [Dreissena polymorpha]